MSQATPENPGDDGPANCVNCGERIRRFGQTRRWCHDATGNVQCSTSLDNVRSAREAADAASRALRRACLDALATNPLRQVAIAAGKNRQTIYNWAEEARRG